MKVGHTCRYEERGVRKACQGRGSGRESFGKLHKDPPLRQVGEEENSNYFI